MAINQNSQIPTYPGTVSEKGSAKTNARTDVTTIGEIAEYMRIPENEGGGGLLPVPGNLGNSVDISANMALVQTLVTLGFDMSRVQFPNETLFPRIFDYSNSKFSRAKFVGADMDCSVVEGEESNAGSFEEADLSLAIFANATVKNVNFTGCNLQYAVFSGVSTNSLLFNDSDLTGANVETALFNDCIFDDTTLDDVDFSTAEPIGERCSFASASVSGTSFAGQVFSELNVFDGIYGDSASFSSCEFTSVSMNGANLSNSDFGGSLCAALTMNDVVMFKCDFTGVQWDAWTASGDSLFEACDFTGAVLSNCVIAGVAVSFLGCKFDSDDINEAIGSLKLNTAQMTDTDTVQWIDGTWYIWAAATEEWLVA
jgi:uncharacterized protein YjbI with pentapeptide repeats